MPMVKDLKKSLSEAVSRSIRGAKFFCGGTMPISDPGLEVKNVGALRFPLKPKSVRSLVEQCQIAPFGKGTQTLVDTKVRKTFELSPDHFQLSDEWNSAVIGVTADIARELGLPPDELRPQLYKLLVYKSGGFFAPHRDSEKNDGMVASLIVVLPNPFDGGDLVVRHGSSQVRKFSFEEAASARAAGFAAFYADCEHEVKHVISGVRVCLAYNLILSPSKGKERPRKKDSGEADLLVSTVRSWFAANPSSPLVFAMEHQYTERGLSAKLLKGTDRSQFDLVASVARETDCHVHLAHVTRHLSQFADDGSFGNWDRYGRQGRSLPRNKLQIGETYEDELIGTQWTDKSGKKQPWGDIPLRIASIVSETPIDDWKPTSEEYEGYTGNAGNTLDRWYHRTAIALWPKSHHFAVVAASGPETCIPLFIKLMSKLAKPGKARKESVRADCIAFARAIISTWPMVYQDRWEPGKRSDSQSILNVFRDQLVTLNDRETIVTLLLQVATRDQAISLKNLIRHACQEFGIEAMADGLRALLDPPPNRRWRQDFPVRDLEWLADVCEPHSPDAQPGEIVRDLCLRAAARFREPCPEKQSYGYRHDSTGDPSAQAGLPLILKALLASGCHDALDTVIRFVESNPDRFTLEHGRVPALQQLVPWSARRLGRVAQPLQNWLALVRKQLEAATSHEPEPPADWARPATVSCGCEYCVKLSAFLKDSTAEVGRIAARDDIRSHLVREIEQHQFDVTYKLEKRGSPYSLVLNKTQESFERAVKRYQLDSKLLQALPSAD
jgi:2OG-Fe(II) oxygenase superfamily